MDQKKNEPESETAFVIIPRDGVKSQFVVVKDRNTDEIFENKNKFPGGGKENGEILEATSVRETLEETGLDIFPPTEKLLEVHKPSVWDGGGDIISSVHRDVFFESQPPIDLSFFTGDKNAYPDHLVPGSEIEKVEWLWHDEILEDIKKRKFFPNHGAAFFWRSIREQFLKTRDSTLLYPITRRKNLHWRVHGRVLIFCFYNGCPICWQYKKNISEKTLGDAPYETETKEKISGSVKFLIVRKDEFFDYVYLWRVSGTEATFRLPFEVIEGEETSAKDIADTAARRCGWDIEFLSSRKVQDHFLILAHLRDPEKGFLKEFCINKHPSLIFLEDDREWREICEALTDFNRKCEEKIHIHHSWWVQKNPKIVKTDT